MAEREVIADLSVTNLREKSEVKLDKEGNPKETLTYTVVAKAEDGTKLTVQSYDPFPWAAGDPLLVRFFTSQAKLDEFKKKGKGKA